MQRPTIEQQLAGGRVLLLDGAMGTMIQTYGLTEEDFRGERFTDLPGIMKGNNDLLSLTRPDVIGDIHRQYLEAGADIITANTFNAQRISMADYACEQLVPEMNREAVRLARRMALQYETADRPRYVVATVGPTNKTLSMSPDVDNPAFRAISFDEMCEAYTEQMTVLMQEGVDGILLETCFDTLNVKAGIEAFVKVKQETGCRIPLMISVTVNDRQGRLLSGQTLEGFLTSIQHAPILSVGLNCSFGAAEMLPSLRLLSEKAPYYISVHPNAGLPNTLGGYDQTPEMMQEQLQLFLDERLANIIGGCCGTTPAHIKALDQIRQTAIGHTPVERDRRMHLSGLEPLYVTAATGFVNVGERCNVAGSKKFLRLIKEKNYAEALDIARRQVQSGAMVIDINMDDGLLETQAEMEHFLHLIAGEPDICRIPIMIDSSKWEVICAAIKCVQGKCIVNSISLKEGPDAFISHAREIKRMGAAVVVMAFDEEGQADTYERKTSVCRRAYDILTGPEVGFPAEDIIFDPNILAIATGIPEHDSYALDFIRATGWIRQNLTGAHVSGGVSNLSFAFRGNNYLREAMHAVFLFHAQRQGMDFGIVNPATSVMYDDIPEQHLAVIEDAMLRPCTEATECLTALAEALLKEKEGQKEAAPVVADRTAISVEERLVCALKNGQHEHLEADLTEALGIYPRAIDIIEGPLMQGMNVVGTLFGEGKMFLPQVIKTARTMKEAVAFLQPYIEAQKTTAAASAGKVLLATVKGDVHDIGKNIVSVVMACNGYEIIDLGVMVPAELIVGKAMELRPDIIGLSGLITPSLEEMTRVVSLLGKAGLNIPVMIGGATTSALHTALRIAPAYDGPVIWVKDASQNVPITARFISPTEHAEAMRKLAEEQEQLRQNYERPQLHSFEEAKENRLNLF